ncbi:MAG: hypothetical protein PHW96_04340 [Candidatus Nanoarchaeia archaeon]|nr:hypothetical protein [Candidatus Nanoarchaeia archaeon]
MSFEYKNNKEFEEGVIELLSKYSMENRSDYIAFMDSECIDEINYKRKNIDYGLVNDIQEMLPILGVSLDVGNCSRLDLAFSPEKFAVNLVGSIGQKIEGRKVNLKKEDSLEVKIITPDVDEKTVAFEIRKSEKNESGINGTFFCHRELFSKLENINQEIAYYFIAYFDNYFISENSGEFSLKAKKLRDLALAVKERTEYTKTA